MSGEEIEGYARRFNLEQTEAGRGAIAVHRPAVAENIEAGLEAKPTTFTENYRPWRSVTASAEPLIASSNTTAAIAVFMPAPPREVARACAEHPLLSIGSRARVTNARTR